MIRELTIQNFRCIRSLRLDLEPLTVLVGPNGAGKTTVLHALQPTAWGQRIEDRFMKREDLVPEIAAVDDEGARRTYGVRVGVPRGRSHHYVRLDVDRLRGTVPTSPAALLAQDGANLPNAFFALTRDQKNAVATDLCAHIPTFRDVDVEAPPATQGSIRMRFQDRWSGVWYSPEEVSDGTLLVLAYLVLQHQARPDVLAIEEPERSLHPYLIEKLFDLFRKMTSGEVGGKKTQIVIATHSPHVLDFVEPHEVRFLDRDPTDGNVVVHKVDVSDANWEATYREYSESFGSVWLSGGMGGVPGDGARQ